MPPKPLMRRAGFFARFARSIANISGKPITFALAVLSLAIWGISGPVFRYSDTWQLVINTGTTIVTFLMVFLIQNTQNRDSQALQLKLDELIRVTKDAHTAMLDLEELSDDELHRIHERFLKMADQGRKELRSGRDFAKVRESANSSSQVEREALNH